MKLLNYLENGGLKIFKLPLFDSNLLINFLIENYLQKNLYITFILNIIYTLLEYNQFNENLNLPLDKNLVYECVLKFDNGLILLILNKLNFF